MSDGKSLSRYIVDCLKKNLFASENIKTKFEHKVHVYL